LNSSLRYLRQRLDLDGRLGIARGACHRTY
jgi:hypothetical protein